ncbi:hypothetical protein [Candidatus Neptunochlamydia vexilliferae]|uniref:hypothetical protein n=1 Tax=Candidatus Neptunichlamydia vexilliferae TaxID=1651774 RepID=UPI001E3AC71F|nr:hypothetical protein [Candidatus Neptunochlamydia vexilliferae]
MNKVCIDAFCGKSWANFLNKKIGAPLLGFSVGNNSLEEQRVGNIFLKKRKTFILSAQSRHFSSSSFRNSKNRKAGGFWEHQFSTQAGPSKKINYEQKINIEKYLIETETIGDLALKKHVKNSLNWAKKELCEINSLLELPAEDTALRKVKDIRNRFAIQPLPEEHTKGASIESWRSADNVFRKFATREIQPLYDVIHESLEREEERKNKVEFLEEGFLLEEQKELKEKQFDSVLREFYKKLSHDPKRREQVYLAYSHPHLNFQQEKWMLDFLKELRSHLNAVGCHAQLDTMDVSSTGSPTRHMKDMKYSDTILLFGSRSLLHKHEEEEGTRGISIELMYVQRFLRKWKQQKDRGMIPTVPNVIPVILGGNLESAFPVNYESYRNVLEWPSKGYFRGIQDLIAGIYGGSIPGYRDVFNKHWETSFKGSALEKIATNYEAKRKEAIALVKEDLKKKSL